MNKSRNITYCKDAKKKMLNITLMDLGVNEESKYELSMNDSIMHEIFERLIVFTPTNQSHLGIKFSECINNNNTDKFLEAVFSGLGVKKDVYLFNSYSEKDNTSKKIDLFSSVENNKKPLICLRCDNGVKESLYGAVRNALAHGNIVKQGKYYILYSVKDIKKEYESQVSFFLRISKLSKLQQMYKVFDKYLEYN